jgi:hypothetical protein
MSQLRRANILLLAAAAIWLAHAAVALAAGEIEVVAISGDGSPDGNGAISVVAAPALNDAGRVAFVAGLSGTQGGTADDIVVLRSGGPDLGLIARKGVSTLDGTTITGAGLTYVGIDNDGTVSGTAALGNPLPLLPFVGDGGPLVAFVSMNSASPSGNNSLTGASFPALNDQGVGVFRGIYSGGNPETGIYVRSADGTLSTRLLQGATSPRGGTITALNTSPTINEAGQVGVRVNIGSGIDPQVAVLRLAESGIVELAREGDTADDGITTIETIQSNAISINDSGQMAFAAEYEQPGVGRSGIFLVEDESIRLVAPGLLPQGSTATTNMRVAGLNNEGRVAFHTEFLGGIDPLSGIYVTGPEGPEVVAFEDTALPAGGKFFRRFLTESIALNENGQVAFLAELANSANGPLSGRGLFLHDPQMGLQTILQTGESFEGSTVFALGFTGTHFLITHSPDTSFDGLNSSGQVAFAFSLSNNRQGIAVWSPDASDGDFNGDGIVDAADYVMWRKTDGRQEGYDAWRTNFGRTAGSGAGTFNGASTAVPEPGLIALFVSGAIVVLRPGGTGNRPERLLVCIALAAASDHVNVSRLVAGIFSESDDRTAIGYNSAVNVGLFGTPSLIRCRPLLQEGMIMSGRLVSVFLCWAFLLGVPQTGFAAAFIRGAYYRLGDADPGATPGVIGNDPTQDSFGDDLDLARFGSPRYSADVPPRGPWESKLSMAFANEGLGGPAFPGFYGRQDSLSMVEQGYALEAWVKRGPSFLDVIQTDLLAYNGDPETSGFGLFMHGEDYVARIGGTFERVLGPATVGQWHHLAYVQSLGTASYYYDGKLVHETTSDPLPSPAKGGFWLGGQGTGDSDEGAYLFNGWIDEVRYQSFNPLSAGAFNPTAFLIREPAGPGDFNADGIVDAADYVVWRENDGNQEGYSTWRENFGHTSGGVAAGSVGGDSPGANSAVPEPACAIMLFSGVAALVWIRKSAP